MSPQLRLTRISMLVALAFVGLASFAVVANTSASTIVPRSTRSCAPPKYPSSGYFTSKIKATNVTCTYAKSFVLAYYKCRTNSGRNPAGRCRTTVRDFRCSEVREGVAGVEIDGRVTCRRGTQKIVHTYQQNIE